MAKRPPTPTPTPAPPAPIEGPHASGPGAAQKVLLVGLESILAENNDRRALDAESIEELATSMARIGLQQPVGVATPERDGAPHRLVWGFRRLAAARRLGWTTIPAVVVAPDGLQSERRLVENLQREQLTGAELAVAVARLYQADVRDVPETRRVVDIATRLARPVRWVRDQLYLARLAPSELDLVHSGRLPLPHAREICKIGDDKLRADLARRAAAEDATSLPMSLDDVRDRVTERLLSLADVPWRLDQALPGVEAPACASCPHNTANDVLLFGALPDPDERVLRPEGHGVPRRAGEGPFCLKPACYTAKQRATDKALRGAAGAAVTQLVKAELTLNGANLEQRDLVPQGVRTEALLSSARAARAAKSKRANAKAEKADAPKDGKKYMERWEVESKVRGAQSELAEKVRADVAQTLRDALQGREMQQLALLIAMMSPEWTDLLSYAGRSQHKRYLGPAVKRVGALVGAKSPAELMALEPCFSGDMYFGKQHDKWPTWERVVANEYTDHPGAQPLFLEIWRLLGIQAALPALPDDEAVEREVIADLVKRGKIKPPPGFKAPEESAVPAAVDKLIGESAQAQGRREKRRKARTPKAAKAGVA